MYLSALMTNVAMTSDFMNDLDRFKDDFDIQATSLDAGLTGYGDDFWPYYYYSAGHGVATIIVTTMVLIGPILLLLRRWRLPMGGVTAIFLGYGLLVNIMTSYRDAVLIIPLVLSGLVFDLAQQRFGSERADGRMTLGGIRSVGPAAAAVLWISDFIVVALTDGMGWPPSMWVGALLVGIMTGFATAFLVAPPSYGPRLVEADED